MSDKEVQELRKELRLLQSQVAALQIRVAELEGYEVISYPAGESGSPPCDDRAPQTAAGSASASSEVGAASSTTAPGPEEGSSVQSWEFRLEVAREIGSFLRRAVEGGNLGTSGRQKVTLKSRLYIIVKDRSGNLYTDPVRIERTWRCAKALVEKDGSFSDAIFVGVPSE